MRKMIYVPSEEVWEGIREGAKEKGKSVSSYLLDGDNESEVMLVLKGIESKLDLLLENLNPSVEVDFLDNDGIFPGKVIIREPLENKFFGPEKLVKKAIKLKAEKKTPAQESFFNPTPKKG